MQVGWQMGAGMEKGLLNSVASMARRMPEIMAQITPRVQMPALAMARVEGQGAGITVQVYANVNKDIDLEAMAYRVASVIARRVS